jgi:hypothetical protein
VRFSERTSWDLASTHLSGVIARARAARPDLVDLTEHNPTRVGLRENAHLAELLSSRAAAIYDPHPMGARAARQTVAGYYRDRSAQVDPERIILSASTSESYAWLFKLLCDPQDEVLVPSPSYPLFTYLAGLESVRLRPYPLRRDEGFRVDTSSLIDRLDARTRAVIMVHPNNPTGTFVRRDDADAIDAACAERSVAVIADEVFLDHTHRAPGPELASSFAAQEHAALTFVLSGLSKVACAPQLKLGWMVVTGPDALARAALARLEVIADTYLSVSTPVQVALAAILAESGAIRDEVCARLRRNLAALDAAIADVGAHAPMRRLPAHAGWSVLLEVPRIYDEDRWIEILAEEAGALVMPGYFFDLEHGRTLVLSLLVEPEAFSAAVTACVATIARHAS